MNPAVPALAALALSFISLAQAGTTVAWDKDATWNRVSFVDPNGLCHDLFWAEGTWTKDTENDRTLYELARTAGPLNARVSPFRLTEGFVVKDPELSEPYAFRSPLTSQPTTAFGYKLWTSNNTLCPGSKAPFTAERSGARVSQSEEKPAALTPTPFCALAGPVPPAKLVPDEDANDPHNYGKRKFAQLFQPYELILADGKTTEAAIVEDGEGVNGIYDSIAKSGASPESNANVKNAMKLKRQDLLAQLDKLLKEKLGKEWKSPTCFSSGEDLLLLRLTEFYRADNAADSDAARAQRLDAFYKELQANLSSDKLPAFVARKREFMKTTLTAVREGLAKTLKASGADVAPLSVPAVAPPQPAVAPAYQPKTQRLPPALTPPQRKNAPVVGAVPAPAVPTITARPPTADEDAEFNSLIYGKTK